MVIIYYTVFVSLGVSNTKLSNSSPFDFCIFLLHPRISRSSYYPAFPQDSVKMPQSFPFVFCTADCRNFVLHFVCSFLYSRLWGLNSDRGPCTSSLSIAVISVVGPVPSTTFQSLPLPSSPFHYLPVPSTTFHSLPLPSSRFY
jgi:hypothetical protein